MFHWVWNLDCLTSLWDDKEPNGREKQHKDHLAFNRLWLRSKKVFVFIQHQIYPTKRIKLNFYNFTTKSNELYWEKSWLSVPVLNLVFVRVIMYYKYCHQHNRWPNGCSVSLRKDTTVQPTIVLRIAHTGTYIASDLTDLCTNEFPFACSFICVNTI